MLVTISRQAATNGGLIGRLVAERLGVPVFDRELVEEIARRLHVDPDVVTPFDEATLNPVESILWEWRTALNEQIYRRYLTQALRRIHAEGDAVIIGRGANYVLRCSSCLHVRLIAPLPLRVAIQRAGSDLSETEAAHRVRDEDRARRRFVQTVFHEDIDDPKHYDLLLNLGGLAPELAVELIVTAARGRVHQRLPVEPHATLPRHVEIMTRHRRPVRPEVVERFRRTA